MRLLIALPLLLLLVLFTLSNRDPVRLGLWPTDYALVLPLSLAIIASMAAAFLAGGLLVWVSALAQRRRARHAEQMVRLLESQCAGAEGQAAATTRNAALALSRMSVRPSPFPSWHGLSRPSAAAPVPVRMAGTSPGHDGEGDGQRDSQDAGQRPDQDLRH